MREWDASELIHDVEKQLGLERGAPPSWGYESEQRVFPEEAPTKEQRRFAGWCLRNLSYFVEGYELAVRRGKAPPLAPAHVEAFYYQEREELQYRWGDTFSDFCLTHVLGSAKRQVAWLEELKAFEETPSYDRMLQRLRPTLKLLEQTVKPAPPSSQMPDSR